MIRYDNNVITSYPRVSWTRRQRRQNENAVSIAITSSMNVFLSAGIVQVVWQQNIIPERDCVCYINEDAKIVEILVCRATMTTDLPLAQVPVVLQVRRDESWSMPRGTPAEQARVCANWCWDLETDTFSLVESVTCYTYAGQEGNYIRLSNGIADG